MGRAKKGKLMGTSREEGMPPSPESVRNDSQVVEVKSTILVILPLFLPCFSYWLFKESSLIIRALPWATEKEKEQSLWHLNG